MKGFKDSSKTVWISGGYAKGGRVNGAAKVSKVMKEFKSGELHSGSKKGPEVTNRKQAVAIALSEAGKSKKMASGGPVKLPVDPDYEDEGVMRRAARPAPKPMARPANPREPMIQTQAPARTLLDRKLSTLPSQRGEMLVGKCGGGLAAMPRKK